MINLLQNINNITNTLEVFKDVPYHNRIENKHYNGLVNRLDKLIVELLKNKEYNKLLLK